jgi:hypothetical protein
MGELERKFNLAMKDIYNDAKRECGYVATRFLQMLAEKGGVSTAKNLITKEGGTEGFAKLWECGRLDLSIEALILRKEYQELFTEEEKRLCKDRLLKFGYKVD